MLGPRVARLCALLLCLGLAGSAIPLGLAATDYALSTDHSIDVPERTVEHGGDTFAVTAIARADPGENVSVTATAPAGDDITVYLYDDDQQILAADEGTGTTTFSFALDPATYPAGTYAFVLQHDGAREAVHPLVVRGYATDVSAPDAATVGDTVSVAADVEKLRGDDLDAVEVVVATDDTTVRESATGDGSGTYTAEVDTSDLSAGTYSVYANVRGDDSAFGERELLGASDPVALDLRAPDGNGGGGGGGGGGAVDTTTATPDPTTVSPTATTADPRVAERVSREIVDERPETPGVTVAVDAGALAAITFEDEAVQVAGNVTVAALARPPDPLAREFGEERVVTAVDVSVPDAAAASPATVRFALSGSAADGLDPARLGVVHVSEGGMLLLPTEAERTDGGLVVTAETSGFSAFAVVQLPDAGTATAGTGASTADGTTPSGSASTDADGTAEEATTGVGASPVFELLVVAALLALVGAGVRR